MTRTRASVWLKVAVLAAFLASSTLAAWVGYRDCALGAGLPVHSCPGWASTHSTVTHPAPASVLRLAPLDGSAYARLAAGAESKGDRASARRLYSVALERAPRELGTREWVYQQAVADGNMVDAANALDALLALDEQSAPARLTAAEPLLTDPLFRETLARRLLEGAAWRWLLPHAFTAPAKPAALEGLLQRIAAHGATPAEAGLHVALLERLGRPRAAKNRWQMALAVDSRSFDALIFDGGFEAGDAPPPYRWHFENQGGAAAGVDAGGESRGAHALLVTFDDRATDFTGVWQDTTLEPGRYRLALQARVRFDAPRPLAWTVACRPSGRVLARLSIPPRTAGWTSFATHFDVPGDCPMQQLRFASIGRHLAERSVAGEVWFDEIAMQPQAQAAP